MEVGVNHLGPPLADGARLLGFNALAATRRAGHNQKAVHEGVVSQ